MHAGGRDDLLKLSVRTSARAASSEDESPVRELHFKYDWPEGHTRCRMSLSALGTYVNCAVPRGLEAFSPVRCISFFFGKHRGLSKAMHSRLLDNRCCCNIITASQHLSLIPATDWLIIGKYTSNEPIAGLYGPSLT